MASELRKDLVPEGDVRKESTEPQAATTAEDSQASDNEGGERPVRNKLKETSITSAPTSFSTEQAPPQEGGENPSRDSSRGRKRSFDDDEPEKSNDDGEMDDAGHRRKRSRDSSYEEANTTVSKPEDGQQQPGPVKNADDPQRKILSPKKKRSRDQLDKDETKTEDGAVKSEGKAVAAENGVPTEKTSAEGEPEKKRHRDTSQEREKAPVTSAFANTSTVSPFGSLGASAAKKEEESKPAATTSSSAFASSSLAAFSGSEQSPFGSLGSTTTSVFKSPETTEATKPAATGFAAAAGSSGFSALGSGFSAFSGGFGSSQPKAGLTSFASPSTPSALSSTSKDKPFGAPADEEEEEEDKEENGDSGPGQFEQDKTDERFFERPIETGEEEEKTYFSCKAKLFQFSDKEWRERGIGTFKVNVKVMDGKEDKKSVRLIMRADGVGRVMLNTPIFKGMTVGDASGNEPNSKQIHLASLESGRSVPILLRTGHEDHAKELYQVVCDLLKEQ